MKRTPFEQLRALRVDPPHRQLLRVAKVGVKTRFPLEFVGHPLGALALIRERGLNAGMLHALHATQHPQRAALVDGHRTVSYAQADAEISRVAHALRHRLGLERGEAIALAMENRAEYVLVWFAAMRAGVRVLHAGSHLTTEELAHVLLTGRGRVVFASGAMVDAARAVPRELTRVVLDGAPRAGEWSWADVIDEAPPHGHVPPRAPPESVVFTSGTTGRPKGAARDFLAFGPFELARVLERLPFKTGERHLVVAPLSHSAPQVFALVHTALGATLHLEPRFDAAATARTLGARRIQSVFMVPTMLRRLLDQPSSPTPELRAVVVGSSEFSEELRREAIARFGATAVFDFYGATELGWVTLIRGDEMLARPGSVGRALAGQELCVLDERGRPCPPRTVGLIGVRNAQTMLGYTGDEAATHETRRAGWTTVEDTGWLDEDGYLYLSGRARDMVKSGGVNVYPAEVERVLLEDPQIREAVVIGRKDREWGERVTAVVVPRGAGFDAEAARERAKQHLSAAKVPREWVVVDALPRNANGKVLRTELRARFP
ncbi:MAG: class I adenylate-forming enzyme family protein [Myxococcota bacterium]